MPTAPPTEFVSFLAPPGPAIQANDHTAPPWRQPEQIPPSFVAAMSVRRAVFVDEQAVAPENELDADDERSFHWVAYASVVSVMREGGRKGADTSRVPVATVRLVPPSPAFHHHHHHHHHQQQQQQQQHPQQQQYHHPTTTLSDGGAAAAAKRSRFYDGREPYAKLGRLATLPAYRGLGLGKLVIEYALDWAGKHPLSIVPLPSATSTEAAKIWGGLGEHQQWKGLVLVHAQKRVEHVWRKLGFERDESMGSWIEEGIEHVGMWRRIPVQEEKYLFR